APQQAQQVADLGGRTRPVLRAEREDGEIGDAEFARGADGLAQRLDAPPVSFRPRQAARGGPAAVAIHDDGDVPRAYGRLPRIDQRRFGLGHRMRARSPPLWSMTLEKTPLRVRSGTGDG